MNYWYSVPSIITASAAVCTFTIICRESEVNYTFVIYASKFLSQIEPMKRNNDEDNTLNALFTLEYMQKLFLLLWTHKIAIHTSGIVLRKLGRYRSTMELFVERHVAPIGAAVKGGGVWIWVTYWRIVGMLDLKRAK
jgi:hypothetical protein